MKYRPEIDGLRALAVIPVIFFHVGFEVFSGGFVGVDVFFVISGYLITSIIINEKKSGIFSFKRFYERRARRILPGLYVMLVCCTLAAWLILSPNDGKDFYQSLVATVLFSSNILFFIESSNYFGLASEYKPLLHTWSLGIEEQYYFIYPFALTLMLRVGKNFLIISLIILALLSLNAAIFGSMYFPSANFYLLPFRCWELLFGALAAIYNMSNLGKLPRKNWAELASSGGLLLIAYAVFFFNKDTPSPGLYSLVPTIGAILIIAYAKPSTFVGRVLSSKVFVYVGLISYSAYLWHQPIISFGRYYRLNQLTLTDQLFFCILSLVLGALSWKIIEGPSRNKLALSNKVLFSILIAISILLVVIGLAGHRSWGFKDQKLSSISSDRKHIYVDHDKEAARKDMLAKGLEKESFLRWTPGEQTKVLILGDSMSQDLWDAIAVNAALFQGSQFLKEGLDDTEMDSFYKYLTSDTANIKKNQQSERYKDLKIKIEAAQKVVLAAGWTNTTAGPALKLAEHIEKLKKQVYIVDAFRVFTMSESSFYFANSQINLNDLNSYMFNRLLPEQMRIRDYFIDKIDEKKSTIIYIDKFSFFCQPSLKKCFLYNENKQPLFHDEVHLTIEGVQSYGAILGKKGFFR